MPTNQILDADTKTTDKAHQGRPLAKQWSLPKSEKDKAPEAAKEIAITDADVCAQQASGYEMRYTMKALRN